MKTKVFVVLAIISANFSGCLAQGLISFASGPNHNYCINPYMEERHSKFFHPTYIPAAKDIKADPKAEKILRAAGGKKPHKPCKRPIKHNKDLEKSMFPLNRKFSSPAVQPSAGNQVK